jgi:predicted transcriptional regulator
MVINNPDIISIFTHDKKMRILELLIEGEYAITDLKNLTDWNPGMIKRFLDELLLFGIIEHTRIEINEYGIKLKYYRSKAKRFHIDYKWPKILI